MNTRPDGIWAALLLPALLVTAPASAVADTTGSGLTVLDTGSPWRCYLVWRTPQFRTDAGELIAPPFNEGYPPAAWKAWKKNRKSVPIRSSALPPESWREPEFDDGSWARCGGRVIAAPYYMSLLCLRGQFEVKDPGKVGDLSLSVSFRGGAVVYLNGREVARAYLPKGKIEPDTPAADYPKEAWFTPDGDLLSHVWHKKHKEWLRNRVREISAVKIPAGWLRKGVNVLAIELHRAPVIQRMIERKTKRDFSHVWWSTLGLEGVKLVAPAGAALVANVSRPRGFMLWNHPVIQRLYVNQYASPTEPLRPIVLVGARNGSFSGQVVASSGEPIRAIKAECSDLVGEAGRIPASRIQIRYALPDALYNFGGIASFDSLAPQPPAEVPVHPQGKAAIQPIWITVHVPADAKAGEYVGVLTVGAEGVETRKVPVRLRVAGWKLPDPEDFVTHVGLIQSPDSVAMKYKVKMWSEEHWRLLEESFELLGQVGTKTIYIPLRSRTYFGNEHSMVRWIRAADGSWKHDFSIAERYLDLAVKHLGKVPVVCLYCWDVDTDGGYFGKKIDLSKRPGTPFTVLDPKTGALSEEVGPRWGEAKAREFWRPVFAGMRDILRKRGLEKSMMVGICGDRRPSKAAVEDLRAVAPEAKWVISSHGNPRKLHGQPVGYLCFVWGVTGIPDPQVRRYHGWKNPELICPFPRSGSGVFGPGLRQVSPLAPYRMAAETALVSAGRPGRAGGGLRGFGRCGADFWPLRKEKHYGDWRYTSLAGRYPETNDWHGGWLHNSFIYVLGPGKHGPVATTRLEMLREGLQEAEARVFIEKALLDETLKAKLGKELARKCQELLDERTRSCRRTFIYGTGTARWNSLWLTSSGWQERSAALYSTAAEVAAKLGVNR